MAEEAKYQKFIHFLIDYLQHASFHGVWHLTRIRRNHFVETLLWSFTIIIFVSFAISNASLFWSRYLYNPTVVTIDRDYLNRNITFPPITLCFRTKLNESAMNTYLIEKGFNESKRDDPRIKRFMRSLAHFTMNNLSDLISEEENYFNVNDYLDILMRISNKFPHNITISSTSEVFYFEPILSDEVGLCYTFNSRLASYLSPNFLISGNLESNSRVKSLEEISYFDGDANAVTADLTHNVDIYYHGPNDLPSSLKKITNEDAEQKSYISIALVPVMIKAQEITRKLFVFQRKCKFEDESTLVYFPLIYTADLCRLDCRMRKFQELCNCLPFFYKRRDTDEQCNKEGLKCIVMNKAKVDSLSAECSCFKDCNDIKYTIQESTTMFWFHNSRVAWTMLQTKVIYKRELIHGFIEALVSTGANLSLFIGMSCLTFVEIFFFTYMCLKHKLLIYLHRVQRIACRRLNKNSYSP